jgi:hypothetical protein
VWQQARAYREGSELEVGTWLDLSELQALPDFSDALLVFHGRDSIEDAGGGQDWQRWEGIGAEEASEEQRI